MAESRVSIHTPKNLGELSQLYLQRPDATLFAGGTYLLSSFNPHNPYRGEIISLEKVEELKRLNRTERYLEIGAMVPLPFIIKIGSSYLPESLLACLKQIAPLPVQTQATLGGNLCCRDFRFDSFTVLLALGARAELRRGRQSRWLPLNQMVNDKEELLLEPGEFVTRIRFPLEDWDREQFIKLGPPHNVEERQFVLCNLIKKEKETLSDLRLTLVQGPSRVVRLRNLEAQLTGRKLPLNPKDLKLIEEETALALDFPQSISGADLRRIHHIYGKLFHQLDG